jgi:DNA topoisomerase-3
LIVIYAEKADVGNKIAAALGGFNLGGIHIDFKNRKKYEEEIKKLQRQQGYLDTTFNGQECKVTWGYGHLYGLQNTEEYNKDYKTWKNRPVCFIPERFLLHPITSSTPAFQKILDRQRKLAKDLFSKAEYVVCATDYDREGSLIFSYVCEASNYRKPFKRVLFTSQTEEGIKDAFSNLISSKDVMNVEFAGRARGIYDWCIGTNLTTQMTLKFPGNKVLSIGRVQTPVLKMIVDREEAIKNFVPKISWNIKGNFGDSSTSKYYSGLYKGDGNITKEAADDILKEIEGKPGKITSIESKKVSKEVPLLYSQTSLQIDASKIYGYTAKDTLDAAQYLYENGYASYPRTKSQYLTDDMQGDVEKILAALSKSPRYSALVAGGTVKTPKRFFNSEKVISHFAIIPTSEVPTSLNKIQQDIYDLIAYSLIRTIYPNAILEKTSLVTTVNDKYDFNSSGTRIIDEGWLAVASGQKETFLPYLKQGEILPGQYEAKETKTEPPKRYDDGSLVKAMKTAGKDLDDAEFKAILADPNVEGIGTDATRAEIIETLVKREYIYRKGKSFYAADKGINLIHSIPVPDMMSPEFTARMEQNLSKIENGSLDYNEFLEQVFKQTREWCEIVANFSGTTALSSGASSSKYVPTGKTYSAPPIKETKTTGGKSMPPVKCPVCGENMKPGLKAWNCSSDSCDFHIFRTMLSHTLTDKEMKDLLKKKRTGVIKDFVSKKTGKQFSARLTLDDSNNIKFDFDTGDKK